MVTHNEAMSGFEYAAATGMFYEGLDAEGLKVIAAIRDRYDGKKRNPFCEIECGFHYARAMSAYGAVLAMTGFHYSGVEKVMKFKPADGMWFWANGETYGTVKLKTHGKLTSVELEVLGEEPLVMKTFELSGFGSCVFDAEKTVDGAIRFEVKAGA